MSPPSSKLVPTFLSACSHVSLSVFPLSSYLAQTFFLTSSLLPISFFPSFLQLLPIFLISFSLIPFPLPINEWKEIYMTVGFRGALLLHIKNQDNKQHASLQLLSSHILIFSSFLLPVSLKYFTFFPSLFVCLLLSLFYYSSTLASHLVSF
jgi:hypothetical protein